MQEQGVAMPEEMGLWIRQVWKKKLNPVMAKSRGGGGTAFFATLG